MMHYLYNDSTFGFGFGGSFMMLLFWIAIIYVVICLVRESKSGNRSNSIHTKSALDVLKDRYVKGEINKQEFEEKKNDIQ